jgi:hypothetical protein
MTDNKRLDRLIRDTHLSAKIAISTDRRRFEERTSDREDMLRDAVLEYEQYLLTLDEPALSAILDLSAGGGSVFITTPVEIDNERFHHVSLYHNGRDLLYGPPVTGNTDPLLRVPDGKYRFVLIAIPEGD